jgi:hypothetical protein
VSALDRFRPSSAVVRQVRGELSWLEGQQLLAERRMHAERQLAQHGVAQSLRLRDCLRVIEQHNPDAAPTASVFVRLAEGAMIAAALEFQAQM